MEEKFKTEDYWEHAGKVGYAKTMYTSEDVEKNTIHRMREIAIEIGKKLGLNENSHVIDLGCGDGSFANNMLSKHFKSVDGFDLSSAAIDRASSMAVHANVRFTKADITQSSFCNLLEKQYDGAFLIGILHHVKDSTPTILSYLKQVTKRVIVLEPNGNNILRKLLEFTPTYKSAGEKSFKTKEMEALFHNVGYRPVIWKRLNLFPNFTPDRIFQLLKGLESVVEQSHFLRALCTTNMWGFVSHDIQMSDSFHLNHDCILK